jgi:hypothetical protein
VVGGLVGLGIPEGDVRWYQDEVEAGRILVTVSHPDGRGDEARDVIHRAGGGVKTASGVGTFGTGLLATPY